MLQDVIFASIRTRMRFDFGYCCFVDVPIFLPCCAHDAIGSIRFQRVSSRAGFGDFVSYFDLVSCRIVFILFLFMIFVSVMCFRDLLSILCLCDLFRVFYDVSHVVFP